MNHYEELAVAQDASDEEIRQAYRALARLLHPDNQPEPKLKSAAERQMIRLNEILATLTDPQKRRKYDESLITYKPAVPVAAPPPPAPALHLHRQLPWILACCILVGVGFWYWRSNESGEPVALARPVQPDQAAPSVPLIRENRPPRKALPRPKPSPPPKDPNPPADYAPDEPLSPLPAPSEPAVVVPAPAAQTIPVTPEPHPDAAVQPATLAGHWFYAPGSHDSRTPGMYAPEFIELSLSEEQGVLSGKYWARYHIPDKPVSPEVQFRVSGAAQGADATNLKWVSDDGATGQMKIELHGSNSMEVNWWTTAFGEHTALTSGTAVLVRQQTH